MKAMNQEFTSEQLGQLIREVDRWKSIIARPMQIERIARELALHGTCTLVSEASGVIAVVDPQRVSIHVKEKWG